MAMYKLACHDVKISLMNFINKKINIVILKNCILPISHNLDIIIIAMIISMS